MNASKQKSEASGNTIDSEVIRGHWQGHRSLTRKVIEAFPEDKLFTFSVGGMRPFSDLAREMIGMAVPGVRGIVSGVWEQLDDSAEAIEEPKTKAELLAIWDKTTTRIDELWKEIPAGRFDEVDKAFGQWEGPIHWIMLYWIDNEIHHRGQGYVYLRALGIEPPPFWDRPVV